MARGGRRPGAGRKPTRLKIVPTDPTKVVAHPASQAPERAAIEPPSDLTPGALAVWTVQAPHARTNGTLTDASAAAFARYCRYAALESECKEPIGWLVAHVNRLELQFNLTPCGKPLAQPEEAKPEPVTKLARFRQSS